MTYHKFYVGCKYIYTEQAIRERVFGILRELLPNRIVGEGKANPNNGRPGMMQWKILVFSLFPTQACQQNPP
uniref:Uncharacterized protein n=1 Tax=Candidatus Kentrum sp. LPFa TaxID=2126335 RepID=A0A450WB25_9GAMM|nr:MAG: hypothetical protein BECKLPF1236B_GA0070989_105719 [Candidatus Kentron sp. LPFa]